MQTPAMEPLTVAPGNESSTLFVPGTTDREAFAAAGAQALLAQSVHRRGADVLDVKTIAQDFSGSTAIIPAGALTTGHLMLPGEGAQPQEREVPLHGVRVYGLPPRPHADNESGSARQVFLTHVLLMRGCCVPLRRQQCGGIGVAVDTRKQCEGSGPDA